MADSYCSCARHLTNQESEDLSDVDLLVGMDINIAAITQKTYFPDVVWFPPVADPLVVGSVTAVYEDGHKVTIPTIPTGIKSAPSFRIRCNRIFSHSTVQLTIAAVALNLTQGVELHSEYAPKR